MTLRLMGLQPPQEDLPVVESQLPPEDDGSSYKGKDLDTHPPTLPQRQIEW